MTDQAASASAQRASPWERFLKKPVPPPPPRWNDPDADVPPEPQAEPSRFRLRWPLIKRLLQVGLLAFIAIVAWLAVTAPLSKSLEPIAPPQLTLLATDGQPIARNGAIVNKPVEAAKLPAYVKQAFIAIEDRRFYSHWGLDPRGIIRAFLNNLFGTGKQGASTITQQLAKFTFLTADRTYTRKAREAFIALWLEFWLTKDEILERYLSNAYFGENLYGLRAASLHYFFRQPERLTLSQAVTLAGLVQAPNRLAPTKNPKAAAKRARLVLRAMADVGYISEAKAKATGPAATDVRIGGQLPTGTYFADWAMPVARGEVDQGYGELKIKTTLDARLQRVARGAISRAALGPAQVALVAMRPDGEVVAMVGGKSYQASPFNRATQARRQAGSTFKLFVYLAALRSGMTPDSKVDDSPIKQGEYRPNNYGDRYRGSITLRQAFAQSSNVAAVRLYQQLGHAAVLRAARDLGIKGPIARDPSVALGSSSMTLLELTSAYAAIAADRYPVKPHPLETEEQGFLAKLLAPGGSFSGEEHAMLLDLLRSVVTQGTGRGASLRLDAFGKTGTSQEGRDALFVGFAGDLVVGVWVGRDDNQPLKTVTGGGLPARIWRDFMMGAVKGAAPVAPPKPVKKPDPEGPVLPLDLPELPEFPPVDLGNTQVEVEDGNTLRVRGDLGGIPLDVRLGKDGLSVEPSDRRKGRDGRQ